MTEKERAEFEAITGELFNPKRYKEKRPHGVPRSEAKPDPGYHPPAQQPDWKTVEGDVKHKWPALWFRFHIRRAAAETWADVSEPTPSAGRHLESARNQVLGNIESLLEVTTADKVYEVQMHARVLADHLILLEKVIQEERTRLGALTWQEVNVLSDLRKHGERQLEFHRERMRAKGFQPDF